MLSARHEELADRINNSIGNASRRILVILFASGSGEDRFRVYDVDVDPIEDTEQEVHDFLESNDDNFVCYFGIYPDSTSVSKRTLKEIKRTAPTIVIPTGTKWGNA